MVMPYEADKDYVRIRGTQLGRRYKIANVLSPQLSLRLNAVATETEANARLIAAAPELYDALSCFVAEAERKGRSDEAPVAEARVILSRIRERSSSTTGTGGGV
jgi:hypothetical protein